MALAMTVELVEVEPVDVHLRTCSIWTSEHGRCDCDSWMGLARCRDLDPDLFFPVAAAVPSEAMRACADCPVLDQCREFVDELEVGLDRNKITGVWAGETASARLRRRGRRT